MNLGRFSISSYIQIACEIQNVYFHWIRRNLYYVEENCAAFRAAVSDICIIIRKF